MSGAEQARLADSNNLRLIIRPLSCIQTYQNGSLEEVAISKTLPLMFLSATLALPSLAYADPGRSAGRGQADAPGTDVRGFIDRTPGGPARGSAISGAAQSGNFDQLDSGER